MKFLEILILYSNKLLMVLILKELRFFDGFDGFLSQAENTLFLHQIETRKKGRHQSFSSRMELPMKQILITFFLFISAFSKNFENDIAYKLVSTELNGAVPTLFLKKAFSHEKLEIHDIIVERFEKPYEKNLG